MYMRTYVPKKVLSYFVNYIDEKNHNNVKFMKTE